MDQNQNQNRIALMEEALRLASGIIDYCPGDVWERECTGDDRMRFQEIYRQLFPEPVLQPSFGEQVHTPVRCGICSRRFINRFAYEDHCRDSVRHRERAAQGESHGI